MGNLELVVPIAKDNISIEKDDKKCIECGYCRRVCNNEITVGRMYDLGVTGNPICINCGQCANMCPTEAIKEKMDYINLRKIIKDKSKTVVVSIAPAVRAALGEEFGIEKGTNVEEKIVTALKLLGAKYVFDITFGADLTIMEEAMELVNRIKENKNLPQFTSCCPAWSVMAKKNFPDFAPYISMALTPMVLTGRLIKKEKPNAKVVFIGPCAAKKLEASRKSIRSDIDFVLTFEEVMGMFNAKGIELDQITTSDPLTEGTNAGRGFAVSGGVAKAVKDLILKEHPGTEVKVQAAEGLKNCKTMLMMAKAGRLNGYLLEGMACPGGCVAGAGTLQPINKSSALVKKYATENDKKDADESAYGDRLQELSEH